MHKHATSHVDETAWQSKRIDHVVIKNRKLIVNLFTIALRRDSLTNFINVRLKFLVAIYAKSANNLSVLLFSQFNLFLKRNRASNIHPKADLHNHQKIEPYFSMFQHGYALLFCFRS